MPVMTEDVGESRPYMRQYDQGGLENASCLSEAKVNTGIRFKEPQKSLPSGAKFKNVR